MLVNVHLLVSSTLSVDLESTFTLTQNVYAHATYNSTFAMVCRFNTSFLANPWQYKYGICTNNDNNPYNMENENKLLAWQPINGSHIDVNKRMLAVNAELKS